MSLTDQQAPVLTWTEPEGIAVRGTLVVIPGRGEQPAHYERFGRRIPADGYRVHAVTDPTADAELAGPRSPACSPAGHAGFSGAGRIRHRRPVRGRAGRLRRNPRARRARAGLPAHRPGCSAC